MIMKLLAAFLLLAGLTIVPGAAAESDFLRSLTPEQRASAGLDKLSPGELARLDALLLARETARPVTDAVPTGGNRPGWITALITLDKATKAPEAAEALESQLVGEFSGWEGKSVFRLKNGQIWQQNDTSTRAERPRMEPKVRIFPGLLGAYWLEVEGIKQRVKVKPIKLQ